MTAPLYDLLQIQKPALDKQGNRGLWFERFFDQYDPRTWEVLKPTGNTDLGNTHWLLKNFNNQKIGEDTQLAAHANAQIQLAASLQGQHLAFRASWHFVTGMGNPHPVENGFAWHPTLGVPYLTGAAVKGLVRSYIENNLDDTKENRLKMLLQWFGSDDKDPQEQTFDSQAGELIFFDAIPLEPVTLGVDIMTPHMGKWYEKGGTDQAVGSAEAVPADWHDPVPVAFLVAKSITLLFSFALRQFPKKPNGASEPISLADVEQVLTAALNYAGAGGKTSTGYGGMEHDVEQEKKNAITLKDRANEAEKKRLAQEQQSALEAELVGLSPLMKTFKKQAFDGKWLENKDAFVAPGIIEAWLDKLEEENDAGVVSMLVKLIETHLPSKLLDNPVATNKKGKPEFKPRQQQIGKRLNELRK
ncbi:MAG TPA: type III-B CRISPR module RAMP protein Cmr6 [Thiolinea sp.]|nr:type III-B CRISPR module RAMP protein Cmr6 [Thiolinea sp.]